MINTLLSSRNSGGVVDDVIRLLGSACHTAPRSPVTLVTGTVIVRPPDGPRLPLHVSVYCVNGPASGTVVAVHSDANAGSEYVTVPTLKLPETATICSRANACVVPSSAVEVSPTLTTLAVNVVLVPMTPGTAVSSVVTRSTQLKHVVPETVVTSVLVLLPSFASAQSPVGCPA